MVSDFGTTRYCRICDNEIVRYGDCVTMSADSKFCECIELKRCEKCGTMKNIRIHERICKRCNELNKLKDKKE